MLRILIGTGVVLMAVGFGAAGWQYWSSLPAAEAMAQDAPRTAEGALPQPGWLMSPTGGLIPRAEVRAYLAQDRLVAGRIATVIHTAVLTDLLAEGETLPAQPYLQVFADIRAPRMAEGLCEALLATMAQDCALHSARVVRDSVDAVRGTARFHIDLAYRLKPETDPLPDLGAHVYQSETLAIGVAADVVPTDALAADATGEDAAQREGEAVVEAPASELAPTVLAALDLVIAAAQDSCLAKEDQQACRIMALSVDWSPGVPTVGQARISWLSPLPEGLLQAPGLDLAPAAGAAAPQG